MILGSLSVKIFFLKSSSTKQELTNAISLKADKSTLASVATSGSYTDLSNTPVNVSAFLNDKNYITVEDLNTLGFLNQEQVDEIFNLYSVLFFSLFSSLDILSFL